MCFRGVWYDPKTYPLSWELDLTEGPSRMRRRLQRCYLRMKPEFLLPEHQHKISKIAVLLLFSSYLVPLFCAAFLLCRLKFSDKQFLISLRNCSFTVHFLVISSAKSFFCSCSTHCFCSQVLATETYLCLTCLITIPVVRSQLCLSSNSLQTITSSECRQQLRYFLFVKLS